MAPIESDDDFAAVWAIRLDAGPLDKAERDELELWLTEEPRRSASLLRAQAALSFLDRGRALGTLDPSSPIPQVRSSFRIGRREFLVATSGLAAAAAGVVIWSRHAHVVDTGIGELRSVPLDDGSLATLNTRTRVQIEMVDHERTIRLVEGEAWFRVAKEKKRPFVVEAGNIRVRALGTAFSVRRRSRGSDVLVTDGVVEAWVVGREDRRRQIASGSLGYVPEVRAEIEIATAPQEIERALAWRGGELALNGETLGYAATELNRYNVRQIVVSDPQLGSEPLIGYFRTTEPENFARTVAGIVGGRVVTEGEIIRIEKPI